MPRGDPTQTFIHLRLTEKQRCRLRDLARMSRRTHSDVIRILIEDAKVADLMMPRELEAENEAGR